MLISALKEGFTPIMPQFSAVCPVHPRDVALPRIPQLQLPINRQIQAGKALNQPKSLWQQQAAPIHSLSFSRRAAATL